MSARARAPAWIRSTALIRWTSRPGTTAATTTSATPPPGEVSLARWGRSGLVSLAFRGGGLRWGRCPSRARTPIATPLPSGRAGLPRRPVGTRHPRLYLALSGRHFARLTGSLRAAPAATSPPPARLRVGWLRTAALGPGTLRTGRRGSRDDSRQATWPSPATGLLARTRVLLLDPLLEFGQPLLHRPLDLRARCAWLVRPDARPVRANGFGRRVGVGRFGFERELRREFRHLPKS